MTSPVERAGDFVLRLRDRPSHFLCELGDDLILEGFELGLH
jgi:hypothetical protein